jgi:putative ABC transport system permease protein
VTGIIRPERRSHIRFEAVVSDATWDARTAKSSEPPSWREDLNSTYTYIRANPDVVKRVDALLPDLVNDFPQDPSARSLYEFELQPITAINLGRELSNEIGIVMPSMVGWFLAGFALVIMLIAGFNYVILTIARSLNRSREVGVRRVLGAQKGSIFRQFLLESVLLSLLALVFGFALLAWMLPGFNALTLVNLSESRIGLGLFTEPRVYGLVIGFSVLVGLLAGAWPARLFTAFEPVDAITDQRRPSRLSRQTLRKLITVTQFTFAIVFVITSIAMLQQFRFMSRTDYGFDREHVVNVALQDVPYERIRDIFGSNPEVRTIAGASRIPALGSINSVRVGSDSVADDVIAHGFDVDENYIDAMGLNLLTGRNFDPQMPSDSADAAILGRSAVDALELGTPNEAVGAVISVEGSERTVVGVIDDFISNNPTAAGDPIIFRYRPDRFRYAVVKTRAGSTSSFVQDLQQNWAETGSLFAPRYKLLDDQLNNSDIILIFGDFLKIFGMLAFFAVGISCLGLLGMAMYSARNRVKEIGIRKVLGATPGRIAFVLSREYLVLIGVAVVVGGPIAWLLNRFWLGQLSHSITLGPALFGAGIAATILIAVATVATQTVRASRSSIVDNLRTD